MKAIVYTKYGGPEVLKLKEINKPEPKDNDILIKIFATSVNYGDLVARNFKNIKLSEFNMPLPLLFPSRLMFGFFKPKKNILGSEFAGKIETIGKNVKKFNSGDNVFGYLGPNMGANTEYLSMPEDGLVTKMPSNLSYEEACNIPYGAMTALNILSKVNIQKGSKVLVVGASGSIGSNAMQIAKHLGAEVTGVCSTKRIDFVKALGADKVIDYTKEDFTKNEERYDLIFDILGKGSFSRYKKSMKPNGIYLLASFKIKKLFQMLLTKIVGGKKVICALSNPKIKDLKFIKELAEDGKIRSIIDKSFPLEQTAEAHKYLEDGNKKGNVVISIG